jgi:uncharacterized membrane protein
MPAPAKPGDRWEQEQRKNARDLLRYARVSFFVVGTMPWWLPALRAWLPLGAFGLVLDGLFITVCHRLPERTLDIAGVAMPLCSRCGGIFTGLALGALLVWPRVHINTSRWLLAAAGALMLADVLMQDFGVHPLWHATRLGTGVLLGWIASAALMVAIMRWRRIAVL